MNIEQLVRVLDRPELAGEWLEKLAVRDPDSAHQNLLAIAESGVTLDLLAAIASQLELHLASLGEPDRVLENLRRFITAARSPLSLATLFDRDAGALPTLLQLFSSSQHLSDMLIADPECFDLIRITEGQPVGREVLVEELMNEVRVMSDENLVMRVLRRFRRRETLRIAYGDIVKRHSLDTVTQQLTLLAESICEAAVWSARQRAARDRAPPLLAEGKLPRFAVIALGRLGAAELNYSGELELMFLGDGSSDGHRSSLLEEFYERLARNLLRYLSESTELGVAYRVELSLRQLGTRGPLVTPYEQALHYYDESGRTWERQAFVKARHVAGEWELGHEFLTRLEPWVYRNYLGRADISGIKALKRRIEHRATVEGDDDRNLESGRGGIRDIEYVIQFLQLLNAGDLHTLRVGNTLEAIDRLERAGCLTMQERSVLEENYMFLRHLEHRLQIMFGLESQRLPDNELDLQRLAIRSGYSSPLPASSFRKDLKQKTEQNRKILDHLLHDAFGDEAASEPEVDLVLDPEPDGRLIAQLFARHGFADPAAAYSNLMGLATESIRFLSTRRCRHFLASIAARLLNSIGRTPDPDATLGELVRVSDSLGGKGALWELFSTNEPSMELYVRLCSAGRYLSTMLINNPGMIDELMDSLLLERLPTAEWQARILDELCRGAEELAPILHSFKNMMHLRIGVRDLLGKEPIESTHRALTEVAEVCLQQIAHREFYRLVEKFGEPSSQQPGNDGQPVEFVIVALGKLGGREPNYHSNLEVLFLYEADGVTQHRHRGRRETSTSNQHFFGQLGQRILRQTTQIGGQGRLYELDRPFPSGVIGAAIATSYTDFLRNFEDGQGHVRERLVLCKSRPIYGSASAREQATNVLRTAILHCPWSPEHAAEIAFLRFELDELSTELNLKRSPGGTLDIEYIVQLLQLRYAAEFPQILVPGTIEGLRLLRDKRLLANQMADKLIENYRHLRSIEARLRLLDTSARHSLPDQPGDIARLAFLSGTTDPISLLEECRAMMAWNRQTFTNIVDSLQQVSTT